MNFIKHPSKFIKPSTPTPPNLKHYKIGFIDELAPSVDVSIVLFFTKNSNCDPKFILQLEKSLEKTLVELYPLAGRYVEESRIVDCNDEGVEFIHAKVNITLEDILGHKVNVKMVDEFIPSKTKRRDVVLTIQLTTFECGGVALGVSSTHSVLDASTLFTFLNDWATMNRGENEVKLARPIFNSSSLFPTRGFRPISPALVSDDDMLRKYTRKRLSFSESAISDMKSKTIASGQIGTRQVSKLQLISAVICKALISVDRMKHEYLRVSIIGQPINLRGRMASTIPKNSCGNLCAICATEPTSFETTCELINLIHDSIKKTTNDYSKVHHDSEQGQMMVLNSLLGQSNITESMNAIPLTSWCKFGVYEVDFGFGKPVWAFPGTLPMKNLVHFIDGEGGQGVEAYIVLEVKDVPHFEAALDV